MRIAYIIADRHIPLYGQKGASIHIQETINALVALGHELTVFVARQGKSVNPLPVQLIEIGSASVSDANALPAIEDKRRFKEEQAIELGSLFRNRIIQEGKNQSFDFIYERYSLFSTAGVDAADQLGIPALLEVNSPLIKEQLAYRKLVNHDYALKIERRAFSCAHAVLAVSTEVREYVLSKLEPGHQKISDSVYVIPNAVDTSRYHPAVRPASLKIPDNRTVVGFVGSLKPWHGIDILLRAMHSLMMHNGTLHLLIIGDGPLREWIASFVESTELQDFVTLTNWIDNRELPAYISKMDIAVAPYPALEDFYFSPLKLFEYFAMGVPVVASDIGQISEVIEDKISGLLCTPGSVTDLSLKIQQLADSAELRESLSAKALELAATRTWLNSARELVSIAAPMREVIR